MNEITLAVHDGKITTTSNQIAEHFGKRHDNVLLAIGKLDCSPEFRLLNFKEMSREVEVANGAKVAHRAFTLTRDGFVFLCMGFTGREAAQWKEKYIAAFNAMEVRQSATPALIDATQAQHLKELVQIVVDTEKQSYAETWARLQRKFSVNSYLKLTAGQFDAACDYLRSKVDGPGLAAIAQKHFPQLALPAPAAVPLEDALLQKLRNTRFLVGLDRNGLLQLNALADDEIICPATRLAGLIQDATQFPRQLLPGLLNAAAQRLAA